MAIVKKGEIPAPPLREETVAVPELGEGAEVVLRQMTLSEYLEGAYQRRAGGKTSAMADTLAGCVLDADKQPLFDVAQWEAWGIAHFAAATRLYNQIRRLSGLDREEETAKN